MQHLFERVLGLARSAFGTVILDANLLEANPTDKPAQEAATFRQVLELVHHAAVHEAEVAGIGRNFDARELADDTVEAERGKTLEDGFALALVPLRVDDLVALAPLCEHFVDEAWRVLQVAVDNHHRIADCMVEPRAEGGLVPEIAAEVDNLVIRIARKQSLDNFARLVLRTVVHENEFVFDILEFFFENAVGFGNDFFFVKDGNDDR